MASLVGQTVKNPPAMKETRVRSLSREDPLEKGLATHFSILVWEILRAEKTGGPQIGQKSEGVVVLTLSKPFCLHSSASVTSACTTGPLLPYCQGAF